MSTYSKRRRNDTRACDSITDSTHSSYSSIHTRATDPSTLDSGSSLKRVPNHLEEEDRMAPTLGPLNPADSSASVNTYNSVFSDDYSMDAQQDDSQLEYLPALTEDAIPPILPQYRASVVDYHVRPSTPDAFSRLFPSMDRLSIRHDDLTPDGNMNLRVDTVVPCSGRRPVTVQLFHLRMHDLARREFSLRRYCRDSGREVCNSKRAYGHPPPVSRPAFHRSMSSALQSLKHPFRRPSVTSQHSHQKRPSTGSSTTSSSWDTGSIRSMRLRTDSRSGDKPLPPASVLVPTNAIKLEFSNYARVDVTRHEGRNSIYYGFEWWGHNYSWKLAFDENLGTTSFHLTRDGHRSAVAHMTPETRSPNQVDADEVAGGWIPPYHMWISDQSVIEAITDVADVIVATGLMALADDSIKRRWSINRRPSRTYRALSGDIHDTRPGRAVMQGIFNRRHSEQRTSSPSRAGRVVAAY